MASWRSVSKRSPRPRARRFPAAPAELAFEELRITQSRCSLAFLKSHAQLQLQHADLLERTSGYCSRTDRLKQRVGGSELLVVAHASQLGPS